MSWPTSTGELLRGPWPLTRTLLALLAVAMAAGVAVGPWLSEPGLIRLLGLSGAAGVVLVAAVVAGGRARGLGLAAALLVATASGVILLGDRTIAAASASGSAVVIAIESAHWSVQRRVHVPGAPGYEGRRGVHLVVVVLAGWAVGTLVVASAAGRLALVSWQAATAVVLAPLLLLAVRAAARRVSAPPGQVPGDRRATSSTTRHEGSAR